MTSAATDLASIVNTAACPVDDPSYRERCKSTLDEHGVLVLPGFLREEAIASIKSDGDRQAHLAYYTSGSHNLYLAPSDPAFAPDHPRNREVVSSKGCITTDQIPQQSYLHVLYESEEFRDFLCHVLAEPALHEYADALSSINLHYADQGQELGWHFDNSSFAITLMIQKPEAGGEFEYVRDVRDADSGDNSYEAAGGVLDGKIEVQKLQMEEGTLVLFRGRNSMHRVTPVQGARQRMLVVLAYNTEPGIELSESARLTFYGRL